MPARSTPTSLVHVGELRTVYRTRSVSYELELAHHGLNKHRLLKGADPVVLQAKAQLQLADWAAQWGRVEARDAKQQQQARTKAEATRLTEEAQALQAALAGTLAATLSKDDALDWSALERPIPFAIARPSPSRRPAEPAARPAPASPDPTGPTYQPVLGLLDKLIGSRREAKTREARGRYEAAHRAWQQQKDETERADAEARRAWEATCQALTARDADASRAWDAARDAHEAQDLARRQAVSDLKRRYFAKEAEAVEEYCDLALSQSEYPDVVERQWEFEYTPDTGTLVVEYRLPAPDAMPTLTEVRYVQSTDSFAEKHLTENQRAKRYDDLAYQVTLRTVHELFEADHAEALAAVVFNGIVTAVNKGTGQEVTNCILSLQASRGPFLAINLAQVDPKQCFRSLKGVGSSALHSVTAVPPVQTIRREDGRFVAARDAAAALDEGYNLATMPWEDFEHLIRQVFEAEFAMAGGEVKVTQASRDGGVDAVVFDPDPIRGGKMVIQAKRYANTVGVSAVRDLYGTLMNEGANKGILVTTSDFGPDAYDFAKGKPLTLLNGGNLLHLLQRQGLKARIDLGEARLEAARRAART